MSPGSFKSPNRPQPRKGPHFFDPKKQAYADQINQEDENAIAVRDDNDDLDAQPSIMMPLKLDKERYKSPSNALGSSR